MFSGYLSFKGILYLPLVILTAVSADFIGTSILYTIFYFSGFLHYETQPSWVPVSEKKINVFSLRISKGGKWAIYMGRVTPFVRGYTSIITGLLQIKPRIFLSIAFVSAIIWASACVVTGRILGPYWIYVGNKMESMKFNILLPVLIILIIGSMLYFKKRKQIP